jgi:hypothetical protein
MFAMSETTAVLDHKNETLGLAPRPRPLFSWALLLLIGYNIEICFMFAVMGIVVCLALPKDQKRKLLGVNNRIFYIVLFTTLAVIVECFLNWSGVLTWEYPWWSTRAPWLLFLIGYLPFFLVAYWVYDMESTKRKAITVGSILAFDVACLLIFGGILNWI